MVTRFIPGFSGPSNPIATEIKELEGMFGQRRKGFNRWYSLLSMEDELKQANMESFVGNDPRTTWNMATFLLQPKPLIITIENNSGNIIPQEVRPIVEQIQQHFKSLWDKINKSNQTRGRETWFWNFIGFLIATGWYAVPYSMDEDGVVSIDYWNPAQVYPEFSEDPSEGLLRIARVRTISASKAMSNARRNSWIIDKPLSGKVTEGHLWKLMDGGVVHGVVMNNRIVKQLEVIEGKTTIPIIAGATAGIPNFDSNTNHDRSDTFGQSILATNEFLYRSFNKLQSFNMQLMRDIANPRILERSTGNSPIIKTAEEWYKRGSMFRGGIQDSIEAVQLPGVPAELVQILFSMRNGIQRGAFSDTTFGNIIGEVSNIAVTQAAEAALQLISPFQDVVIYITETSTNFWYHMYLDNPNLRPSTWPELSDADVIILKDTHIQIKYAIKIPGDLANRIGMAKSLNPRFELDVEFIMQFLLPEVTNVAAAIAKLDAEHAKLHPSYTAVKLIQGFEAAAAEARAGEGIEEAQLFTALAENLRKSITQQPTQDDKLGTSVNGQDADGIIPAQSAINTRLGDGNGTR